jgi:hypothetical protein
VILRKEGDFGKAEEEGRAERSSFYTKPSVPLVPAEHTRDSFVMSFPILDFGTAGKARGHPSQLQPFSFD